jgi:hypothetical protein
MKEIGLENLPNIYISQVEIYPETQRRKRFKVEMVVKDSRTRGKFSWYGSDDLGKYLKVMLVCSSNQSLNDRLDSGVVDFNKKTIKKLDRTSRVKIYTMPITQNEVDEKFELIDNKKVYSFFYDKKFEMPKNSSNVKVYAAVILDTREYSNSQGIDLLGPRISSYSGPVASEAVIKNNKQVFNTTVLVDQSNNIYSGPAHKHPTEGYMEGSFHTNSPHNSLTEIQVPNMKIKNYTSLPLRINQKTLKGSRQIISDLITSHTDEGTASLFSLNIKNLLITRTLRGSILATVNPHLFNRAVQLTRVLKLEVFEEKFESKLMLSKVGTLKKASKRKHRKKSILVTRDLPNTSIIKTAKRSKKTIKELVFSNKVDIRNFVLEQKADYSKKSERRLGVKFEIYNPVEKMILEKYNELLEGFKILKAYHTRSNLPSSTTSNNRRFSESFVNKEEQRAGDLNTTIRNYVEVYSMFNSLTDQEEVELSQNILSFIRPKYATPTSLSWFFKKYQKLLTYYKRLFRIRTSKTSNTGSRGNTNKSSSNYRLSVSKNFDETLSFEKTKNIIDVLGIDEPMPVVSKAVFGKRFSIEKTKFLSSRPNFIRTELFKSNQQIAREMSKINEYLPSYLTPLFLSIKRERISLENFENLDDKKVLRVYKKILTEVQDKTVNFPKRKKESKVRFRRPRKSRTMDKLKPVTDNLGESSSFVNAKEDFRESKTKKLPPVLKDSMSSKEIPDVSIEDYSMNNKMLRQFLINKPEEAYKVPLSIKALMTAEDSRSKNHELLTKTNFVSNVKTFPAFDMFYNTPIKVEYTTNGKDWSLVTNSFYNSLRDNVICRLSYYVLRGLTFAKDIAISNQYFILSGRPLRNNRKIGITSNVENTNLTNLVSSALQYNLQYASTNIISQPQVRNNAFGTRGETTSVDQPVETPSSSRRVPTRQAPRTVPTRGSTSGY